MKELHLDDEGFLVDNDEIRFKRSAPLATIECKLQEGWIPPYSKDFQKAINEMKPVPNAYLNVGSIGNVVNDHHLDDGTPVTSYYKIYKIELYKLGE